MKNTIIATVIAATVLSTSAIAGTSNSGQAQWNGTVAGVCSVSNFTIGTVVVDATSSVLDSSFGGGSAVTFEVVGNSTDYNLTYGAPTVTVDGSSIDISGYDVSFSSTVTHRNGTSTGAIEGSINSLPKAGKNDVSLNVRIEDPTGDALPQGSYVITAPVSCAK